MIPSRPELHPLARKHLESLRARGIVLTDAEVLWIVGICRQITAPDGVETSLIGMPVRVGLSDVWLWPMTVGASIWWRDCAIVWFKGNDGFLFWALAWTLAHARTAKVFRAASTPESARRLVEGWALTLGATRAEIEAAVDAVLPPSGGENAARPAAKTPPPSWTRIVNELAEDYGLAEDHWLWDKDTAATIDAWVRARSVRGALGRNASHGEDPVDSSVKSLAVVKAIIIAEHQAEVRA